MILQNNLVTSEAGFSEKIFEKGLSIYEVIRIFKGNPIFLKDNLLRLDNSLKKSNIDIHVEDLNLPDKLQHFIRLENMTEGNLKYVLHFTSGKPDEYIFQIPHAYPTSEDYKQGVPTLTYSAMRENPGVKYINTDLRTRTNRLIKQKQVYEVLLVDKEGYITEGKLTVSAASVDTMEEFVTAKDTVIVANREDAQIGAIQTGVQCVVVCMGTEVTDKVLELAKEKNCRIITTPYDTFTASRLICQAMPVSYIMATDTIVSFNETDFVDDVKEEMTKKRFRYFPVLNADNEFVGFISRRRILEFNKKQVILVDHNEVSQAVEGLEECEIMEIIDHHRIGSVETVSPVYFRNQPVGCTGTIVAQMYREKGIEITKEMAGLMCSAILSDTLMFRSPTCTPVDEQIARELAQIAGIDVEEHAKAMFRAGSDLSGKTPNEIFYMDYKKFNADTIDFGVGQITSMDQGELDDIKASILEYMDSVKEEQGLDYVFFMLTNILEETTHLLICGPEAEGVIERGFGVTPEDKVAILPGVMSRKKQMIPNLLNAFQQ